MNPKKTIATPGEHCSKKIQGIRHLGQHVPRCLGHRHTMEDDNAIEMLEFLKSKPVKYFPLALSGQIRRFDDFRDV